MRNSHCSSDNAPIPCSDYEAEAQMLNQWHAKTRASQLDMVYQELESATQVALETAFNDKVRCQSHADTFVWLSVLTHTHTCLRTPSHAPVRRHQADLHELQIACNKLSAMISEYEHIKGQAFSDTHSYIRLKKRLADRIRVMTTETEQARAKSSPSSTYP